MAYPADTYTESVELTITASNQLHTILNGDSTTEVAVEDGSKIPSVRKAYTDSLFFLSPQPWSVGEYETAYNQLRAFVEPTGITTWWFSKTATVSTPILMSTTPHEDANWALWNAINNSVYETQKRLAAEAGFNMVGSFLLGATVTTTIDVVFYESDGKYYSWGGSLPKVVPAGSTPATAGGFAVGAWSDKTDLTLRKQLELPSGIHLVSTNRFAVYLTDAPMDGVTDASAKFTSSAAVASAYGVPLIVLKPTEKYFLSSSPIIPDNVDILADPSWFTGSGTLPIMAYMALSEGVDPRIYHSKDWHHSEPPANNGERYWTGQHTVDIKYDQAYTGADSVKQDCVGHGTRAYVRGKNGRGWGGVDLVQLFPSAIGPGALDTSAFGREIDVNNNAADINNFEVIGGPRCKGLVIASGGAYRPEEAICIGSTASTNRFLAAVRWSSTAVEFGITPDEGFAGPVVHLPLSSKGVVGSHNRAEKATMHLSADMSGWDFTGNTGGVALHTDEDKTVVAGSLLTTTTTMAESLSASKSNCLYVTSSMSVNTISNGRGGQEITILVANGVTLTLNTGGNILLGGGAPIWLTGRASIRFRYEVGVWWQIGPAVGGLA